MDSGDVGKAEMYSLGWDKGEPQRRAVDLKRTQSPSAALSPDDGHEVNVLPLHNQVGGHTRLLVLNDSTIIKPLNIRELHFYQNIPEDIQNFVPRYKGIMQASYTGGQKFDKRYSPCFRDENRRKQSLGEKREGEDVFKFKVYQNGNASEILKSFAHMDHSSIQYFLMMENITASYRRPCILDLKMGTRQHGDDASVEKRAKQIAKYSASTSATLGIRLCGKQVWMASTGAYLRRDKYWGRALSEAGLRDALRDFFTAGSGLRAHVVRRVLRNLDSLKIAVAKQISYRFYSCSLLIVYEGDLSTGGCEKSGASEVASSSSLELASGGHFDISMQADGIALSGARSPLTNSKETMGGYTDGPVPRVPQPIHDSVDSRMDYSDSSSELWPVERGERVDIRMIDFANTAFAGAAAFSPLATATPYHGPDCGFLSGVDSLKRLLTEILLPYPYN